MGWVPAGANDLSLVIKRSCAALPEWLALIAFLYDKRESLFASYIYNTFPGIQMGDS